MIILFNEANTSNSEIDINDLSHHVHQICGSAHVWICLDNDLMCVKNVVAHQKTFNVSYVTTHFQFPPFYYFKLSKYFILCYAKS